MSYRKQISYLELQENGQRIKTVGFARLENLDKEDILTVLLNGQDILSGKDVTLYLQRESGEQPLGEMKADRGKVSGEMRLPGKKEREPILGVRIPLEENIEVIGRFVRTASTKRASVPVTGSAPAQETMGEIEGQTQNEQVRNQPATTAETVVANGNVAGGSVAQNPGEFRKGRGTETSGIFTDAPESRNSKKAATENTLHMKDTKWEQLSSIYPHIHPFRDAREFLSVGPEDFVVLQERCYQMTHNSFLLHGYYNYRHLLLMRQENSGEVKYYIGVPGNFYEREKQVAGMFGFESFEGAREPAWDGDFGYYLISVEL